MARGYCPNQECPNIDVLGTERPCPTCGREVREATPKEYWRTRTIKMMHAHEIAEIAEIQEVARRAMGEASIVPKAQEPESPTVKQEEMGKEEADSVEAEVSAGEPEEVLSEKDLAGADEPAGELEEVQYPEGLTETPINSEGLDLPLQSLAIGEMEEIMLLAETTEIKEIEPQDKLNPESIETAQEQELERQLTAAHAPEDAARDMDREASASEDSTAPKGLDETSKVEVSLPASLEQEGEVLENVSEVEEVPFVEGLLDADVAHALVEGEVGLSEEGEETDRGGSEEASVAESIDRFDGREEGSEPPFEVTRPESPVWRRDELVLKSVPEEASLIERLPDDGGVERPASAVRIITFREGSTEIGICPYCGRFIRGSDLSRHKLKHRVRNVLGLQGED